MYPRAEQTLSLVDVAEHWHRVVPAFDKWFVREELHCAWWQGEFEVGDPRESLRLKALMILRELPPEEQGESCSTSTRMSCLPKRSGMAMSSRWSTAARRVRLPVDPARWTEAEITEACDTLAKVPAEKLPSLIQGPLLAVRIDRDVFAAWCDRMGWERPSFWFAEPKPSTRVRATVAASTGFRRYLRELIGRGQRLTKGQVKDMAMQRFPQLSTAEFKRVWEQNVPAEWKRPGRPNKQPKQIDSVR